MRQLSALHLVGGLELTRVARCLLLCQRQGVSGSKQHSEEPMQEPAVSIEVGCQVHDDTCLDAELQVVAGVPPMPEANARIAPGRFPEQACMKRSNTSLPSVDVHDERAPTGVPDPPTPVGYTDDTIVAALSGHSHRVPIDEGQQFVGQGLDPHVHAFAAIRRVVENLPFPLRGIDSDNGLLPPSCPT